MMTRKEQIEEMLYGLNDVVIWSDKDAEIDRIMPVIYWLEAELMGSAATHPELLDWLAAELSE